MSLILPHLYENYYLWQSLERAPSSIAQLDVLVRRLNGESGPEVDIDSVWYWDFICWSYVYMFSLTAQ